MKHRQRVPFFRDREGGITLIEVTIAIFLVFMALTALVALIGAAGRLSIQTRAAQQASLIANRKLEDIRNMDFNSIGFLQPEDGEPAGVLPRSETTEVAGVTFRIGYGIWWVDAPETSGTAEDYKRVTITVSWDRLVNGTTQTASYRVTSLIAQASRRTPGAIINPPPPILNTDVSPPPNAVVSGSSVIIRIDTAPDTGYLYSGLEIRIGGGLAGEKVNINPPAPSGSQTYVWDTTQHEDGLYEFIGLCYEARGGSAYRTWYYYINNSPPTEAPTLTLGPVSETAATLSWNIIRDGNEDVLTYSLKRSLPSAQTQTVTVAEGGSVATYSLTGLTPWTTYRFAVAGVSHGDAGPYSSEVEFKTLIGLSIHEQFTRKHRGKNHYKAVLSWTPCPNPSSLARIEIWKNGSLLESVSPSATTYTESEDSQSGTLATYQVKAVRTDGSVDNVSAVKTVRLDGTDGS